MNAWQDEIDDSTGEALNEAEAMFSSVQLKYYYQKTQPMRVLLQLPRGSACCSILRDL